MDKKLQFNLKFIGTLDNHTIAENTLIKIDKNIQAEIKKIDYNGAGFGNEQVVIEYLFNVLFVGVPSSLIATLIYDYILKGKNRFIDKKREKVIITKEELESYIEEIKREKSN